MLTTKGKLKLDERRRYIRVDIPLEGEVEVSGDVEKVVITNISPNGLRLRLSRLFKIGEKVDLNIILPHENKKISLKANVVWYRRVNTEDNSPYDIGVEIISIAETSKIILAKYLCDLFYDMPSKMRW
ncbi:Type IV pilus assembly PilZ domain protein [Candidatus Omnitrophus magneticus]|uniref:Type IV pilus assembly PilZ domain protein n=1 Tax=Candidatus Omnitrophus magneticus TaxID=1609969 RepID=A0A0F0CL27_9BACT|nr:Type IV pilus assembly PilZ domain protein [Candidatus Omnitrophus magneticus]